VLRALRKLLRPGGRIAFTTIYVTPGLSASERRRAHRSGPRAVASRSEQTRLLVSARFVDAEEVDVTASFAATATSWLRECEANAEELATLEGQSAFDERQHERRILLAAIEDGLLRRGLFSATRPDWSRRTAPTS
jgi:hypothetical protein